MAISKSAAQLVVTGGLIAASLDIAYAVIYSGFRGVPAIRILQSVASGLLGKASYEGGIATATLGLALHYAIVMVAAFVFWFAARHLAWLTQQAVIAGLLYGAAIYVFMNGVVLPLSAFPHKMNYTPVLLLSGLAVHMVGVGLPIAWCVRQASSSAT